MFELERWLKWREKKSRLVVLLKKDRHDLYQRHGKADFSMISTVSEKIVINSIT